MTAMTGQVLSRDAEWGQLSDSEAVKVTRAVDRELDEGQQLASGIASVRRRILVARAALASTRDIELRCVLAAQRVLAAERQETTRVVASIAADADDEVARLLGSSGRLPLAADRGGDHRVARELDPEVDLAWRREELSRLSAKASLLERHLAQVAASRSVMANRDQVAVLEHMLAGAVAIARAEHRQARQAAQTEAEQRLAAAREEAERRGYHAPDASEGVEYQIRSDTALSTELILRPAVDGHGPAASPEVWRADLGSALAIILNVVLPLIALAIVLLVVFARIG